MWFLLPTCTDELEGREALEGLQAFGEVVGYQERVQVFFELLMGLVMIALNGGLLERAVHPLDLSIPIRPGMVRLGEAVINAVLSAHAVEDMDTRELVLLAVGELDAVIGQHRMQLVGHGLDEIAEKLGCDHLGRSGMQFGVSELARAVDGHEQVELPLFGSNLGDVDVEVAQRIRPEGFFGAALLFYLG